MSAQPIERRHFTPHHEISISAPTTTEAGELEPMEVALAEADRAYASAVVAARRAQEHADKTFARYLQLEGGARELRRRRSKGFVVADGTRIFGIDESPAP